ncbi:MAG: calycin-like domain-containing protein [Bacteroidaceae bacterium]|nr:calycin-like domain-containing protein [Bacteroidaceae bacterium]
MKAIKFLALMLVSLLSMTACSDDDNEKPKLIIDPVEDLHGYIFVSSGFFTDSYYGDHAQLSIREENGQWTVLFQDPQWGNATFENVKIDMPHFSYVASGTGTIVMKDLHSGTESSYDATISGDVTNPTITAQIGKMGTVTIQFFAGPASEACKLHGNYKGTNSVIVGGTYGPYTADITCKVTANPDATLNVEIPEYVLNGTEMGNLTLGKVTIKGVHYDSANDRFFRPYGKLDKLTMHFNSDMMNSDTDAPFTEDSEIEVKITETGIKIINTFRVGGMPFPIVATFEGTLVSGN